LTQNILEIRHVSKSYFSSTGAKHIVLEDVNLQLNTGSCALVSILGPFGSGKTTLLKLLAGLESFEGEIMLNGNNTINLNGEIIYIPQKFCSFPWLNVKENIELPTKMLKRSPKQFDTKELINLVGLSGYEDFYTSSYTSGFRVRIAIARALSFVPKLILLDDVFKELDGDTREELINLIKLIGTKKNTLFILATTNITDAILLSQKVFLMRKNPGKIIKEINIPKLDQSDNSEIITKLKNEIGDTLKSEGLLNSILISL
jgi:ABC-type nitrate/sulfonate/bicarbonate transport system ATPase subunit